MNVRPSNNTNTGSVPETRNHYLFEKKEMEIDNFDKNNFTTGLFALPSLDKVRIDDLSIRIGSKCCLDIHMVIENASHLIPKDYASQGYDEVVFFLTLKSPELERLDTDMLSPAHLCNAKVTIHTCNEKVIVEIFSKDGQLIALLNAISAKISDPIFSISTTEI